MKFALNGALTIGTLDGANVEIGEEVGWDNIFIFGLKAHEVDALRKTGYHPHAIYEKNPELKRVLDMIRDNAFSPEQPGLFQPILDSLLGGGDFYLLLEDFASYMACQDEVDRTYADQDLWYEKAILNVARMGKFSSDRAIREYAENIWKIKPVQV
jgi:starch phosphorylase